MSREGVNGVYDKLFQRHLKVLKGLDSDTEDKSQLKSGNKSEDEADDLRSTTSESERLSVLGEELVAQELCSDRTPFFALLHKQNELSKIFFSKCLLEILRCDRTR